MKEKATIDFSEFFQNQTIEETIKVLDEVLVLLVLHTEENGASEHFSHQYLTIRDLRNLFIEQKLD